MHKLSKEEFREMALNDMAKRKEEKKKQADRDYSAYISNLRAKVRKRGFAK
jgi:Skp family chaperone for outer membrane proteins